MLCRHMPAVDTVTDGNRVAICHDLPISVNKDAVMDNMPLPYRIMHKYRHFDMFHN